MLALIAAWTSSLFLGDNYLMRVLITMVLFSFSTVCICLYSLVNSVSSSWFESKSLFSEMDGFSHLSFF